MQKKSDSYAHIVAVDTSNPTTTINQQLAAELVETHYGQLLKPRSLEVMRKVLSHKGISRRHIAVEGIGDIVRLINENPDDRMDRFTHWATALSIDAAKKTLKKSGVAASEISALVVNTCTGYICPGISTYLIEPLGLSSNVKLYDLVGAGCGGALPGLQIAQNHSENWSNGVVLSIAVEICSATYQMGDDMSLLISNAIFGDGAAAAVISNHHQSGPAMVASVSHFYPKYRDHVRYVYRNGQLHNLLSPALPKVISETVPSLISELLEPHSLTIGDITHWAVHAGGEKVLQAVQDALNLSQDNLVISRQILKNYGNMSSPTVLFELDKILLKGLTPGEYCCVIGFGAGLSLHGLLLAG